MKEKLRPLIQAARRREEADLLPHVNDDPPDEPGRWTAKDQLSHLTAWREVAAAELEAARTGAPGPEGISDDDDLENRKIYDRTHDLPASDVIARSRDSWDRLSAAFEAVTNEHLDQPRGRQPRERYWNVIGNQTYTHLPGHIAYWHQERGDDVAAEAVTRWARDLLADTFPGEPQAGVGEYNVGCFYAARGRVAEALPHLRRGFELRPDLRDWARRDPDLDPIRNTPELVRLLAG